VFIQTQTIPHDSPSHTDHHLLSLRRLSIRAGVAPPLTPGHTELQRQRSSPRLHFTASQEQKYWRSTGIGNNLNLGHCESGVWNTSGCCMALPILYYPQFSPTWTLGSLNFHRAMRTLRTCRSCSLPFHRFISSFLLATTFLFVVPGLLRPRDEASTQTHASQLIQACPNKELDRSRPGQPYFKR
jgi:hypothetical protein